MRGLVVWLPLVLLLRAKADRRAGEQKTSARGADGEHWWHWGGRSVVHPRARGLPQAEQVFDEAEAQRPLFPDRSQIEEKQTEEKQIEDRRTRARQARGNEALWPAQNNFCSGNQTHNPGRARRKRPQRAAAPAGPGDGASR